MITKKKLLKQMKIRLLLEAKRTAMSKFKWPIKLTKFGMVWAFTTHPHLKGHSQIALLKFLCFCFKFFGTGLSKYNYISSRSHQIYRKIIIDSAPSFPFSIPSVSSLDALYLYSL